ncbi:hypothetical protein [Shewanella sp. Isolate11]|uniref:hypothetical protein n=1 Tax=Shewanella sp. Isolate11 TaxID=2908530 RepID=UPI001EFDF442|nr:hypothetical protein [Shewanella sp. Isolate11]MCG9696728.1 hypothetical protein [Shewanella sp. Isolate11]
MKQSMVLLVGLAMSFAISAETYDVAASYKAGDEYTGALAFRVDEGKSATYSDEQLQNFSVVVNRQSDTQVLVNFDFEIDGYQSEAEVVLDLDKAAELSFGDQSFTFMIRNYKS